LAYATSLEDLFPILGKIAKPPINLCKKDVKLKWTDVENLAFVQLKDPLSTAPVLAYPDFNERFFLATDASSIGLGAMIYQLQDDIPRPVAFASNSFDTTELNWSIPETALFALIYAMDKFKPYLFSPKFTWITDAKCLTWLHRFKDTNPKLLRWCLQIQGIDFTIQHKSWRGKCYP
jgi:RNase H-like domain found in reverse transcriptase